MKGKASFVIYFISHVPQFQLSSFPKLTFLNKKKSVPTTTRNFSNHNIHRLWLPLIHYLLLIQQWLKPNTNQARTPFDLPKQLVKEVNQSNSDKLSMRKLHSLLASKCQYCDQAEMTEFTSCFIIGMYQRECFYNHSKCTKLSFQHYIKLIFRFSKNEWLHH